MSIYVVSDIHGNLEAWKSIKQQINLTNEDNLYILGDVIDRGEHGIQIMQEIMRTSNMHMILGNHEYMMLNALGFPYNDNDPEADESLEDSIKLWMSNGGEPTLKEFTGLSGEERDELKEFMKKLPLSIELFDEERNQQYVLCHASWEKFFDIVCPKYPEAKAYFCVWDRKNLPALANMVEVYNKNLCPLTLIIGHTPTVNFLEQPEFCFKKKQNYAQHMMITRLTEHLIDIDCGAGYPDMRGPLRGRLACLRLDDMAEFYSN